MHSSSNTNYNERERIRLGGKMNPGLAVRLRGQFTILLLFKYSIHGKKRKVQVYLFFYRGVFSARAPQRGTPKKKSEEKKN